MNVYTNILTIDGDETPMCYEKGELLGHVEDIVGLFVKTISPDGRGRTLYIKNFKRYPTRIQDILTKYITEGKENTAFVLL